MLNNTLGFENTGKQTHLHIRLGRTYIFFKVIINETSNLLEN